MFEDTIEYTKEHPGEAIAIITALYVFLIIFILPITMLHLMVAFAYCKVFNSFWIGFAVATLVIFIGCMLGGVLAFILGRFMFADFIKRKLKKSNSKNVKKFRAIDELFVTDGLFLVAMLRLVFLPYGLASYALSVTSVTLLDYTLGTLFVIFKIMLIVLVGCSIYQASEAADQQGEEQDMTIALVIAEIVLTILVSVWVTCLAWDQLDRKFKQVEREEEERTRME